MSRSKSKCYLDRYLKLFFNESNLFEYMDKLNNNSNYMNYLNNDGSFFVDYVEKVVKKSYSSKYGPQYNIREINMITKDYLLRFGNDQANGKSFSIMKMISEVASEYFVNIGETTHIKSEKLFDYLGFNNKVGTIFLVANMSKEFSELLNQKSLINIDSAIVKTDYFRSIHETHMHYKASGFGVESSWVYLMNLENIDFERALDEYSKAKSLSRREENLIRLAKQIRYDICMKASGKNHDLQHHDFEYYLEAITSNVLPNDIGSSNTLSCKIEIKEKVSYLEDYVIAISKEKYNVDDIDEMDHLLSERIFNFIFQESLIESKSTLEEFKYFIYLSAYSMFCKKEIQQDDIVGFERFKNFEDTKNIIWDAVKKRKSKDFANKHDTFEVLTTIRKYQNDNVNYVEFRTPPGGKDKARKVFSDTKNAMSLQSGFDDFNYKFIFHFIKTKAYLKNSTIDTYFDEVSTYRKKYKHELDDLKIAYNMFKKENFIAAIDTCNHETEVSPWIFAPIYQDRGQLRATYHAGEDFYTLVQGIRSVENVVDYLGYKKGDRIGHGSAILIDVDFVFKKKNYVVYSREIDNFDDLAVIYKSLKEMKSDSGVYLSRLFDSFKFSLNKMITQINSRYYSYLKNITIYDWYCSMIFRNFNEEIYEAHKIDFLNSNSTNDEELMNCFCEYRKKVMIEIDKGHYRESVKKEINKALNNINAFIIYNIYMSSKSFYEYTNKPFTYVVDEDYVNAVKCYQREVREKIIDNEVVVEVNLTSNYLINDYSKYNQHGLYNIRNFKFNDVERNILLSIGTDDSAIFGTSMFFELQIMYMVLIEKGYDVEEALNEVKKIVKLSNKLSFVEE